MSRTHPGQDSRPPGARRFWRSAGEVAEEQFARAASFAVPTVVDALDIDQLLERVDINRLLDRVDVDRLLDRVDVDRLLDRVDIEAMTRRAGIGDIVAESTGQVTASALDLARRQMVGLDTVLLSLVNRLLRRDVSRLPLGPTKLTAESPTVTKLSHRSQVTGHYAGPVTRLAAATIDGALTSTLFTAALAVLSFVSRVVVGVDLQVDRSTGWVWIAAFAGWVFVYLFVGLALTGRTPGKGIVGLRVVTRAGEPLRQRQALVRVLTFPSSFVFGLGFLGLLVGRERRALHDVLAGSAVVYDWGDRPAELPTPLTRYLARRNAVPPPLDQVRTHGVER